MKPKAYILIGVPGSGKSTYVKKHLENCIVASSDDYIEECAAKEGKTYSEVFQKYVKRAQKYFEEILEIAARDKLPLVVDRTNMSYKSRKRVLDHIKHTHELHAIVFPTPEEDELQRRLDNRPGKFIPKNVIESMKANFDAPTFDEGFDTIETYEG